MAAEIRYRNGRRVGGVNMPCACGRRWRERQAQAQAQAAQAQAQAGNVARLFQAPPPPPPPLPVAPAVENDGRSRTLQLFPARAGAAMAWQRPPEAMQPPSPMTIVYGGKVIRVNVPADKGNQLIQMAQSVSSPPPPEKVVVVDDVPDEEPQVVAGPSAAGITANQARKLSVQRFLGKRKQSRTDDPDEASPSKKMDAGGDEPFHFEDVPDASWLSL